MCTCNGFNFFQLWLRLFKPKKWPGEVSLLKKRSPPFWCRPCAVNSLFGLFFSVRRVEVYQCLTHCDEMPKKVPLDSAETPAKRPWNISQDLVLGHM